MNKKTVEQLAEGTPAADSLKPNSRPASSKTQLLSQAVAVMGGMNKKDLSDFWNKAEALIGKEARKIPDGIAAKNRASVNAKGDASAKPTLALKEDLTEIFGDNNDLSEEFKTKVETLFEAAVNARVNLEVSQIAEEFEQSLEEQVDNFIDGLVEHLDSYVSYVADKWIEENEVAIESSLKTEMFDSLIGGLKDVFENHNVKVEDSELDAVEELQNQVSELKKKYNDVVNENIDLTNLITSAQVETVLDAVSEGLTETQKERMKILSENISFEDLEELEGKLNTIKESLVTKTSTSKPNTGVVLEEAVDNGQEEEQKPVIADERMSRYSSVISRTKS